MHVEWMCVCACARACGASRKKGAVDPKKSGGGGVLLSVTSGYNGGISLHMAT